MRADTKNNLIHVLIVMMFCYLPHVLALPVLSVFIISIIVYRFCAIHYALPLPNMAVRIVLIIISLGLLYWQYRVLQSSGFYIGCMLMFTALKILEATTPRDLRVLILCNFYIILTVLLTYQDLWVFLYVITVVGMNLALMVKLTAPQVDFSRTGKSFIKHFLIAIPISLLLFYIFPRFSQPLWRVPAISQTKIGFNEEMTMGNVSEVFNDDSMVMRVTFNGKFKPTLYWRGLVLSHFNGWSWKPASSNEYQFQQLKAIDTEKIANYEIMLEPHQKKWLFYQDNPIAAKPNLLFSPQAGLVQSTNAPLYYRLSYSLIDNIPTYHPITLKERQQNTALPSHGNPRLRKWAKQQFAAVNNNPEALIALIARRINHEPYWYSLKIGNKGISPNAMDRFWFETKRGYCEYYTGAVTIILREAGIPARVVVGYHGGKWNPVAGYLTVQQNDAHAWLEYWKEGGGWQHVDPVTFIDRQRIDPTIHQKRADEATVSWFNNWSGDGLPWMTQVRFYLESLQFFWERWLLFYNQDTQRVLLQKMGFEQWDGARLLQVFVVVFVIILITIGSWYLIRERRVRDPLQVEYRRLQQEISRLGVPIQPPATFSKQLHELENNYPYLKEVLDTYIHQYEQLRLHHVDDNADTRKSLVQLFRALRAQLKNIPTRT